MIASMTFAMSTPIVSAGVTPTSVTYRGNTRVKLDITVTNETGENIDNVRFTIVGSPSPTFSAAIGGAIAAENLKLAADNMENAAKALNKAGENLKLADDNIDKAATALISAAANLQSSVTYFNWLGWVENIPLLVTQASTYLDAAGDAMALPSENFQAIANNIENAAYYLNLAGGHDVDEGENLRLRNKNAAENFDNAARWLDNVDGALLAGSLRNAGENLRIAGSYLENAGKAGGLYDNNQTLGVLIQDAGKKLQEAGNNLKDAATYENNAGTNLTLVRNYLLSSGTLITLVDTDLDRAGENLENAAVRIGYAADNMSAVDDKIFVQDNLSSAAGYLDNAATLLGAALGGGDVKSAMTAENAAAENMKKETLNLDTAGDQLKLAATKLSAAASTMLASANGMGPTGWTISSDVANNVLFSASSTTHIASGGIKTFGFLWTTPAVGNNENDYVLRVYVYKPGSTTPTGTYDIALKIDGKVPTATITVTQTEVATSNLVGNKLDNGKATVTIVMSEVVTLGSVYVENSGGTTENLLPPLSPVSTTDNITFTATFTVGTWDDNSCQIRIASAKDAIGNENTSGMTRAFTVDTRAPVFVDNGFAGVVAGMRQNVRQAGTQDLFAWVDNRVSKQIIGRAEDNVSNADNDLWCKVYVDGVLASKDINENFFKSITLSQGLNWVVVRAVDRTGNEVTVTSDNIFIDTQAPTITFNTITRLSGAVTWTDGIRINDNTPKINLTILDSGYPTTGLGVAYENRFVYLDNDDNINNGTPAAPYGVLENSGAWNVSTGVFENTVGGVLPEGKYWINVIANDNLRHTGDNENWVIAKRSFIVDVTKPVVPPPTASLNPLDGTTYSSPLVQVSNLFTVRGTGLTTEVGSTITVYIINAITGVTAGTGTTTVGSDGSWSKIITLPESATEYQIEVTCTDVAGNEGAHTLYGFIRADTVSPVVTISAPAAGGETYTTDQMTVLVSGTITKETWETYNAGAMAVTATIQIGSATPGALTIDSDGSFSISAALSTGTNTITVRATDTVGHTDSETVTVVRVAPTTTTPPVDTSAPTVTLNTLPASTTDASITVSGDVTKDATETYSDITLTVQVGLTSVTVPISADGSYEYTVPLSMGPNTIAVQAVDRSGNASTPRTAQIERVAPTADTTAPTVTIIAPATGTSTGDASIVVTGKSTEAGTWTITASSGTLTGATDSAGNFTAPVPLVEGSNTIVVTASDAAGNVSASVSIEVTRTVTPWATYAIIVIVIALILAAIAIFRKR